MLTLKKIKYFLILFIVLIVSGCGSKLPDCGNSKTIDLLTEIYFDKVGLADSDEIKLGLLPKQIIIENIETLKKDKELSRNTCQAIIKWKLSDNAKKLLDVLFEPNNTNILSLSLGAIALDNSMTTMMGGIADLAGKGKEMAEAMEKEKEKLVRAQYEKMLCEKDNSEAIKMARLIRGNLDRVANASPTQISDGVITLNSKRNDYTVRLSEDKKSKKDFIVETRFNEKSIELIQNIEGLEFINREGKKRIAEFQKTPSPPCPAKSDTSHSPAEAPMASLKEDTSPAGTPRTEIPAEAPRAEAPKAETPSSLKPVAGFYLDKLKQCKIFTPSILDKSGEWSGECKNGFGSGKGILKTFFKDQPSAVIEGSLVEGKMQGVVKYEGRDGKYEGEYRNSLPNGQGILTKPNGVKFIGIFKNGFPDGEVKVNAPSGNQEIQFWADGKRIK